MRERDIFIQAIQEDDPHKRSSELDIACRGDTDLRQRVEHLLAEHLREDRFILDVPPISSDASAIIEPFVEPPGTVIGRYVLGELIGEGGFGVVYVAEQTEPVRRHVALKVIKPGMDSKDVVARFEAERQALALMNHPHIAQVLDGGATDSGRPYFVMELVKGVPITDYCGRRELGTRDKLELFVLVCRAVQHAHQKGIIHRDLKPSNVLVEIQDRRPVPKIIDFGVAKAISKNLTPQTVYTQFSQLIGTPLYMSPEQTEFGVADIDTRSDVYSLGVLLYELLTGNTPFDSETFKQAGFEEMWRMIREDDPPRPSANVSTLEADVLSTVVDRRRSDPRNLASSLRGELDWIVMKALEKDRNRRYESAGALARDVERHLHNQPVEAYPPSATYRFRKFARRNKAELLTVMLVSGALLLGAVGSTWQAMRASRAEAEALARAEEASRSDAEARAVLEFVEDRVFAAARPDGHGGGLGHDATMRQAVEAAVPFVESSFEEQPLLKSRLLETMGQSFYYLGEYELAAEQFQVAYSIRSAKLGPDDPRTQEIMRHLSESYDELGRLAEALQLKEQVYARQKATFGADHPQTAISMGNIAVSYNRLKRYTEAAELNQKALELLKATPDVNPQGTLACMHNLAISYRHLGRQQEALELHEAALDLRKASQGADHPDLIGTMHELAHSYEAMGRHAEAGKLLQESCNLAVAKLGSDHPHTLMGLHCLANSHSRFGRYLEAKEIHEAVFGQRKVKLGPAHRRTLESKYGLAMSYFELGDFDKACELHEEVLAVRQATLGSDDHQTLASMHEVALCNTVLGRYDEAIQGLQDVLATSRATLGPDHFQTLGIIGNLARTCQEAGQIDNAVKHSEDLIELMKSKFGADHPQTLQYMNSFAWWLTTIPDYDDPSRAMALARAVVDAAPNTGMYWNTLGAAQVRMGNFDEAIKSLTRAIGLRSGGDSSDWFLLAIAEGKLGNQGAARDWYDESVEWMQENQPDNQELMRLRAEAGKVLGLIEPELESATSEAQASTGSKEEQKTLSIDHQ